MESYKIKVDGNDAIGIGEIEISYHAVVPVPFSIKFTRKGQKPKSFAFNKYNAKRIVQFIVDNL